MFSNEIVYTHNLCEDVTSTSHNTPLSYLNLQYLDGSAGNYSVPFTQQNENSSYQLTQETVADVVIYKQNILASEVF